MTRRGIGFWMVQGPGWLLTLYLVYAQAIPAFDYELGVSMGTQEPAGRITEVGAAFWWGFAFGDLVIYIPLLILGLAGHWTAKSWARGVLKSWARGVLSAALGITLYWPVVALAAVAAARGAEGWHLPKEQEYWIVLPLIALWAAWALWRILAAPGRGER
jgi:hypothetical protein